MRRDVDIRSAEQLEVPSISPRKQARRERKLKAHQQAQALRDPTPEHAHRDVIEGKSAHINNANRALILVLFVVIIVCLLASLALGVNVYRNMVSHKSELQQIRLETSLVANSLSQLDKAGAVSVRQEAQGTMIVASEKSGGSTFETRFYLYDGWLVEEYVLSSIEPNPQNADRLVKTSVFDAQLDDASRLLTITTDAGTTHIAIRSDEGGERR